MSRGDREARWCALLAVSMGVFCIQLDSFALNIALPDIGREFAAPPENLQWTVSAYLLAVGALMLPAGRLGDSFGRRRVLASGLAAFGLASVGCALAPSLPVLVAARIGQGAGGALIMPAGLALLTNVFPVELRGRATGWAIGLGGVATACGPFLGGVLAEMVSWRAIFWLNVPLVLIAVLATRRVPESRAARTSGVDLAGLVFTTGGLAVLVLLVERGPRWGIGTNVVVLLVLLMLTCAAVRHARRAANPLVEPALLRNAHYLALTLAGSVANAATVVFLFVIPLALRESRTSTAVGILLLAPALAMALAGPVAGRVRTRHAPGVMAMSLAAAAGALVASAFVPGPAVLVMCGAALGLANALTLVATQAAIDPEHAGQASGLTKTVVTVAGSVALVLARPEHTAGALLPAGVGCLLACLLLMLWCGLGRSWSPRPTAGERNVDATSPSGSIPRSTMD